MREIKVSVKALEILKSGAKARGISMEKYLDELLLYDFFPGKVVTKKQIRAYNYLIKHQTAVQKVGSIFYTLHLPLNVITRKENNSLIVFATFDHYDYKSGGDFLTNELDLRN